MKKLGWVLMIVGLLPYGILQTWVIVQQRVWNPLRYPISLKQGRIVTPEFTTRASTSYRIFLEFDRRIEYQRMVCLLGLELKPLEDNCHDIPEILDVSWQVITNRTLNRTSEQQNSGAFSDTIARQIGTFDAKSGQKHVVVITVRRDASELDVAAPRILIQTYPSSWEGTMILLQLSFFSAILLGSIGIILIIVSFFTQRRPVPLP